MPQLRSHKVGRSRIRQRTDHSRTSHPSRVTESLRGRVTLQEEDQQAGEAGLRLPQVGATYSVLGHWTTGSTEPITVVMPTGTGKTETMLTLFAHARPHCLLIVVPSSALRDQIATKAETLGLLRMIGVAPESALNPVVGRIEGGFESESEAVSFANRCNIMVATTPALNASSPEVRSALIDACSHLFVDEAHHVAAPTWSQIRDEFKGKPVVQFTATPFRMDGRSLGGQVVYSFPLRAAQKHGYFSFIDYIPVLDFEAQDQRIAETALKRLRADLDAGYDHVLMARVSSIARADELVEIYRKRAADLNPVALHSKVSVVERRNTLAALDKRTTRVIVCVDMLGEGFDLPALKVAAIHDPHKSLGITLQFVGRFARVADDQGEVASVVIARPDARYDERLRRLFAEDANWNYLIRDLSQEAIDERIDVSEFEKGFSSHPEKVSVRNLFPKMSTVVYRATNDSWAPHRTTEVYPEHQLLTHPIAINERDKVAWFVTELRSHVRWGDTRTVENISYELFVMHWDEERQLLFINSSNNDGHHEALAKAVAGEEAKRIRGETVYRVMDGVDRLVPTNVGVLDIRNLAQRFSMHVGPDVSDGFPTAEAQTKTQTNIFAYGYEGGKRVSFGASLKGRIWSFKVARSLRHWVSWCRRVGTKLLDDTISVDAIIQGFIRPELLEGRPGLIALAAEWPWEVYLSTTEEVRVEFGGSSWPLVDTDLRVSSRSSAGPIPFDVVTPDWEASYEAAFSEEGLTYTPVGQEVMVTSGVKSTPLSQWCYEHGLTFVMEQDATIISPGVLLKPPRELAPFDPQTIQTIDWDGIDLRKEAQGPDRDPASIQARFIEHLDSTDTWELIVDDDGTGEIADVVAVRIDGEDLIVFLGHCKYSSEDTPGARVADLYEVCGQAQKSTRWRRDVSALFAQLIRREKGRMKRQGRTGLIVGDAQDLYRLEDRSRFLRPRFTIGIVQPGISKAQVSQSMLELLASTDLYVRETSGGEVEVIGSP